MTRSTLPKRHVSGDSSSKKTKIVSKFSSKSESFAFGVLGVVFGALAVFAALQVPALVPNRMWEISSSGHPLDIVTFPSSAVLPGILPVKTHTLVQEHEAEFSAVEPEQTVKVEALKKSQEEHASVPDAPQLLVEWMLSRGASFPNAEMVTYDAAADYRGLHAARDLEVGDSVFTFPDEFIITADDARASPIGKLLEENLEEEPSDSDHFYLAMFLLQERDLGVESMLHSYIQALPTAYLNTPVNYGPEEVAMLEGSYAKTLLESDVEELHEQYDMLFKRIPLIAEKYSFEDYKWGCLTVLSRLLRLPQHGVMKSMMIPLADMINHDGDNPNTDWDYSDDLNAAVFDIIRPVAKGSELSISYGRKGNERLLSYYGFALPDNQYNQAALYIGLPSSDPLFEKKLRLAKNPGAEFYRLLFKTTASPDHPSFQAALKMCRLVVATEEDLHFLPKDGDHLPFSVENEQKALLLLQSETEDALSEFPDTAEADEELLKDDSLTSNKRNIILTRLGEKQILLKIIDFVDLVIPLLHFDDIKEFNKARLQFKTVNNYLRQVGGIYRRRAIRSLSVQAEL